MRERALGQRRRVAPQDGLRERAVLHGPSVHEEELSPGASSGCVGALKETPEPPFAGFLRDRYEPARVVGPEKVRDPFVEPGGGRQLQDLPPG